MLMLTITTETYSPADSGKGWRSKPDTTETETLPWSEYDAPGGTLSGENAHRNITSLETLAWFRRLGGTESVQRSYTPAGDLVTRLVSTNPDRTERVVRRFTFENTAYNN